MNLVAFVICHKLERFLDRAVASVLLQTRRPDRIVLVGTDCREETHAAFHRWRDDAEQIYSHAPMSFHESKNFAAAHLAGGDDCAFMTLDADDYLLPHMVERCLQHMELTGAAAVGCDYWVQDANSFIHPSGVNSVPMGEILTRNPLPCCSIIRTAAFRAVGGYRAMMYEDWALWLTLAARGYEIARYPQPLFVHCRHESNVTNGLNTILARRKIAELVAELAGE